MKKILVVDDDLTFSLMLKRFLEKQKFDVITSKDAITALHVLKKESFDLILSDYKMPYKDGFEFLEDLNEMNLDIPIIFMTSFGDIKLAVKSIKNGAVDYLTKPINTEDLLVAINNILGKTTKKNVKTLKVIRGTSEIWNSIEKNIKLVAPTDFSVIIYGETGVGKEIIANKIHQSSNRANKPFVTVDCGTLSTELSSSELFGHIKGAFTGAINDKIGLLETANEGTIFLDEIGNLSYDVQVKLLRAIQERRIMKIGSTKNVDLDVRIIVASNDDLKNKVSEGTFREDLFYRLNEYQINIPPLRERNEDILVFAYSFVEQAAQELGKSVQAFDKETELILTNYKWPGNVRELKNVVRRMVLLTDNDKAISNKSLPFEIINYKIINNDESSELKLKSQSLEKSIIKETLEKCKFNKSKAAVMLNIDRKTLYSKIKQYDLEN